MNGQHALSCEICDHAEQRVYEILLPEILSRDFAQLF